ncbi:MAG: 4-hydroxyphenylpyruvate dioxygenase [Chloroflexi bacterium]|nr:4-hydroxyphenylpyruvate dioxygenase [Chloroflexota bacterium]OJW02682.1 MAG: 4-hydroxyphenylpyruvate dioxygenase [Chloroflexi bacterium 54-19]
MSVSNDLTNLNGKTQDSLPIQRIDYVEFYVGNARQAAHYYRSVFGFEIVAYKGLETGSRDTTSYVLRQNKITFVVTGALSADSEVAEHVKKHGDGVKDIAFLVDDVNKIYETVTARGAKGLLPPEDLQDQYGSVRKAVIGVYGDTTHTFLQRSDYIGPFLPGFQLFESGAVTEPVGLASLDHMVANVGWNEMEPWVEFYRQVMGFTQLASFDDKDISTEYTALMSKVMQNGNGRVKLPINEPAPGTRKSQVEEYLDFYGGPGIQHLALTTGDILHTVEELRKRGVDFIRVPDTYYENLEERVGHIKESLDEIRRLGLLVDRDDEGYLVQIFTRPQTDRPTFFFEIIQRHNARSFGKGNFKALFEAIEADQALRGTL